MEREKDLEDLGFPIHNSKGTILGEYLPLKNIAWAFVFPKGTKENRIIQIHEFFSHPIYCPRVEAQSDLLISYFFEEILERKGRLSKAYTFWRPIIEGVALANLYFNAKDLYWESLATVDQQVKNIGDKIIDIVETVLRWCKESTSQYLKLHPLVREYVIAAVIAKSEGNLSAIVEEVCPLWVGETLLDKIRNHLHNPDEYPISHSTVKAIVNIVKRKSFLWFLALLLAGELLQNQDVKKQEVALAFFSSHFLKQFKKYYIKLAYFDARNGDYAYEIYCDIASKLDPEILRSPARRFYPKSPLSYIKVRNIKDFFSIPMIAVPGYLATAALEAYHRALILYGEQKSYEALNIFHEIAVVEVFDIIKNAFEFWQTRKATRGIGEMFRSLKAMACNSEVAEKAWTFLNNYSRNTFRNVIQKALVSTEYYSTTTEAIRKQLVDHVDKILLKNLEKLKEKERIKFIDQLSKIIIFEKACVIKKSHI